MKKFLQRYITFDARVASWFARYTEKFSRTTVGKTLLSIALLGPLTFYPTVYQAWFGANIDALRTLTWPTVVVTNSSALWGMLLSGDWRNRLAMVHWIVLMNLVFIATLVR